MANVTFKSPVMAKDVTLYAVAGDRGTLLALAKEHKLPIPFDCGDGNCGSCLVEIKHLGTNKPYGLALTDKEKEMLRQLGKITPAEIENAETNDMPPRHRLACQYFVRDEDIAVIFEGDETLPKARPALSTAVKSYKGGLEIASVEEFLGYAVKVEEDAAIHFEELAVEMNKVGNTEIADCSPSWANIRVCIWRKPRSGRVRSMWPSSFRETMCGPIWRPRNARPCGLATRRCRGWTL